MIRLEVTRNSRTFVALADTDDLLESRGIPADGLPTLAQVAAEAAVDFYGADGTDVSAKVVEEDMDSHGFSGSNADGSPIDDDTINVQVFSETWVRFMKDGEQDGVALWSSPVLSDWPAGESNPAEAWEPRTEAEVQADIDKGYAEHIAEMRSEPADAIRAYAMGLDKAAMEIMDEVIIRRSLVASIERLRYVARKSHDQNAEFALRREVEDIAGTLARWDQHHPGAKLAI